jgi:hypothetical protein
MENEGNTSTFGQWINGELTHTVRSKTTETFGVTVGPVALLYKGGIVSTFIVLHTETAI